MVAVEARYMPTVPVVSCAAMINARSQHINTIVRGSQPSASRSKVTSISPTPVDGSILPTPRPSKCRPLTVPSIR